MTPTVQIQPHALGGWVVTATAADTCFIGRGGTLKQATERLLIACEAAEPDVLQSVREIAESVLDPDECRLG